MIAKPYCYSRADAERIYECLKLREEYEMSTMDIGKFEIKQSDPEFFDTEFGKGVIFLIGVGIGFTTSEMMKH